MHSKTGVRILAAITKPVLLLPNHAKISFGQQKIFHFSKRARGFGHPERSEGVRNQPFSKFIFPV
jgi:hypothetical protein